MIFLTVKYVHFINKIKHRKVDFESFVVMASKIKGMHFRFNRV